MLIDGYNVSMLGWPNLSIDEQRVGPGQCGREHGTPIRDRRDDRLRRRRRGGGALPAAPLDRVLFSPSGVIADDVIRAEVERTPAVRHVVVVTNDAEIARDVRAAGANVLPSNALLAVL